ncbi:MAG: 30S ribosomal protein S15 [Candidatus Doudnabacteria bacterium]|nr:30S ribosomal protein S15 [Candidatus Doudnabacteria bacterium]
MAKKTKIVTKKAEIISKYRQHEGDTGSPQVQIGVLTGRINDVVEHLKAHRKDESARRGLLKLVGQRRRWVRYLEETEPEAVKKIRAELDI